MHDSTELANSIGEKIKDSGTAFSINIDNINLLYNELIL